ncbi:MAG: class II aldolase/adducin family protein [Gammaproteobacteria bacterium]|nr:class II aldolase/adducin family protein [Gammaproteobacteria bacterium]
MTDNIDFTKTRNKIKHEIALGYRIFAKLGWGDLGDGHISGRDPERTDCFWLLDGNTAFINASPERLVLIDSFGKVVDGQGVPNLPAYYIHWPILNARPELTSVAHTHTPSGTPFSAEARTFDLITQEACYFVDDHAVFDDEEVQVLSTDCGKRIAKSLGRNKGLILRNHGLLTVGESVRQSVSLFVLMERVAEAHLLTNGRAQPISHNAAHFAKQDLDTPEQSTHSFANLVAHHLGEDYWGSKFPQ